MMQRYSAAFSALTCRNSSVELDENCTGSLVSVETSVCALFSSNGQVLNGLAHDLNHRIRGSLRRPAEGCATSCSLTVVPTHVCKRDMNHISIRDLQKISSET